MPETAHRAPSPRRAAQLAGLVAAGAALGVGELLSALGNQGQSLVGSVGGEVIDQSPGSLVRTGIDSLGTADKPVLLTTIVVLSLLLGALVGSGSLRHRWIAPVAFGAAGVLGMVTGFRDPLASDAVTAVAALGAAATGTALLLWLLARLPAPAGSSSSSGVVVPGRATGDRRSFLTLTAGVGAAGVVAAVAGRAAAGRTRPGVASADVVLPAPTATLPGTPPTTVAAQDLAVEGLSPLITPTADFYRIDTALVLPRPNLDGWRLRIGGEVDEPYSLTFDELLALPQVEVPLTLSCVSNQVGGKLVGNAVWQGVPLSTLLDRAGVRPGGEQIVGTSLDGFTAGFPTAAARDGRIALVAVGMNGEPLTPLHGFPARLVVEGLYGYVSATKWLSTIDLRGWDFDGYWIPLGWAKEGPIKTQSRIDTPKGDVDAGTVAVAGVAWAPGRGISAVEVQVDDGPWHEAELGVELSDATWRQWMWRWDATPGTHTLRVRATDRTGEVQTEDEARPDPDGATGWHRKRIEVSG